MTEVTSNTSPKNTQERVLSKRAEKKGRKAVEKKLSTLSSLNVEYVKIDSITPNTWNPNRQSDHDFELLLASMEEDGFTQPSCHGRYDARTGAHLYHVELEASLLRDLQSLGALDWAKDSLMLDDTELNRLLNDIAAPEAMAEDDYTEAWVPDTFSEEEVALVRNGVEATMSRDTESETGQRTTAMTTQAVDAMRRREQLISVAKTEQDRKVALKEVELFRLSLVFSGEEAVIVKRALGDHPAQRLLELCTE